jgi:hypothetical protein
MPRAYMPLKSIADPPVVTFSNGVRVVSRDEFKPPTLEGWEQVFRPKDLKGMREWHLAIACDWSEPMIQGIKRDEAPPEIRLANANLALQVAAPIGTFFSACITEQDEGINPRLRISEFRKFRGTSWSRMEGFGNIDAAQVRAIVDGILHLLTSNDPRMINPIRFFEHGLSSDDPYIRILLWVTAIDAITMSIKQDVFVRRLSRLLDGDSLVFPQTDDVYVSRATLVRDVAKDLFQLRSEIAHGKAISKKFWEVRYELRDSFPVGAYGNAPPRRTILLEESALALLTRLLQKTATELSGLYQDAKKWKAYLDNKTTTSATT